MKKTRLLQLLLPLAALMACGDDQEVPQFTLNHISLSDRTIIMEAGSTNASLTVTANCQWTATLGSDKWDGLTINQTNNKVDIVTTANTKPAARTASLIVKSQSGDITRTVTLQQLAADIQLALNMESLQLPALTTDAGSSVSFTVTSNSSWSISGGADWFSYSPRSGQGGEAETVSVTLTKDNTEERENTAILTVSSGSLTRDITVVQKAKTVSLTAPQKTYEATAIAGTLSVDIRCNHSWTVQTDQTWLTATPANGTGDATITVAYEDNPNSEKRTATLTFTAGSKTEQITIVQVESVAPVLGELTVVDYGKTQATIACSFTSLFDVEEYGVCYGTEPDPTVDGQHTVQRGEGTSGEFSEQITGLTFGQTYYVRAYARSKSGIGYSKQESFTTAGRKPDQDDNGEPSL